MKNNLASMFFNENGSFKKPLDPYRYNDGNNDTYDLLFDETIETSEISNVKSLTSEPTPLSIIL